MLTDILHLSSDAPGVKKYSDVLLSVFLIGGAVGGLLFGSLADKWGRKPTMAITILLYSVFSGLTYFATDLWQIAVLRFLVALGVGGEWAVAASLGRRGFLQDMRALMLRGYSMQPAFSERGFPGLRVWWLACNGAMPI